MKILRRIMAILVLILMVPVVAVGALALILSIEIQPENLANLTADVISETLSKDNLKKIKVSEVAEYLPAEMTAELPPDATMEEMVPVAFNSITGIESYVSLETVEKMIDDDVIRDVTLAVINEEDYDFVELVDKYEIPMETEQKAQLAELKTTTIKQGLGDQGYDVDTIVSEQIEPGIDGTTERGPSQNSMPEVLELLQPWLVAVCLVGGLLVFYLLLSLVLWSFKTGLVYWGAGVLISGIALLFLNGIKYELIEFGLGMVKTNISMALITPAAERIMRPVIWAGIIGSIIGAGTVCGGGYLSGWWQKQGKK